LAVNAHGILGISIQTDAPFHWNALRGRKPARPTWSNGEGDSMKRSWTALAVALFALGMIAGCNNTNNSIQSSTGASITTLSPSGVVLGSADFTLTVTASQFNGFPSATVVEWNGQKLATTFVDVTTVTAVVPASLVAKAGTVNVNTFAPQSGAGLNGLSNALAFLIYGAPNPLPTLTGVTPDSAPLCGSNCNNTSLNITLAGTDFLPSSTNGASTVTFNGKDTNGVSTALRITSISSTQIKAVIPGTFLASDNTATIRVVNPPSGICLVNCPPLGGGSSAPFPFTVGTGAAAAATASATAEETPAISEDGRFVAFTSEQGGVAQIMLRDTCVGAEKDCQATTKVISAASDGPAGNAASHTPVMSSDGRYVAFSSAATNLVTSAPAGRQVYLHDSCSGAGASCKPTTTLVSEDAEGALAGTEAILPSISSSGRYVAFVAVTASKETKGAAVTGTAAAATAAPNSGLRQVFVRDTCLGAANCTAKTTRISLQPGDAPANSTKPAGPALSGLAKQVALAEGKNSTVFTPTVAVDDKVFLATINEQK